MEKSEKGGNGAGARGKKKGLELQGDSTSKKQQENRNILGTTTKSKFRRQSTLGKGLNRGDVTCKEERLDPEV